MELRLPMRYTIHLERDEFLIVTKALRGTLNADEKEVALKLQEKMMLDKHSLLVNMVEESQKTVNNIQGK